ncbi:MAG: multifunctional oxoglutarate decarboxylase/oxoglutarate dehydrogenase thiamine pyrophosphate-binding subunit/dihydrolipoyllysine-residue succinyltransferase subunit, partial [Actinomycetales bacterium]|nr:multifunctional oxoglutarate decarboxylase/oxoglutarate dehydrogenase thiamine pyrophosphate-binding subunit/dihydrolipoyllysine-residue succinyltransferase subunit [Actinomycetales bacterium]
MSQQADPETIRELFGANDWLVEELFAKYQQDKNSVDPAWWEFFENYTPPAADTSNADTSSPPAPVAVPSTSSVVAPDSQPSAPVANLPGAKHVEDAKAQAPKTQASTAQASTTADGAAPSATGTEPSSAPDPDAPLTAPVATAQPVTASYAERVPTRKGAWQGADGDDQVDRLRGAAARVVTNMEASLSVPTATSVRSLPAKLMVDNRIVINNHLSRTRGGKISFTHLIGFALVEAVADMPAMNNGYALADGKPALVTPAHVNLGLAIDLPKPDGTRQLLVPNIKKSETLEFSQFLAAYEELVRKARGGKLEVEDFAGTTISLTNPGTIGTVHSVPRLMEGQGTIIGVGAMDYPAEFAGTAEDQLNRMGVSKVLTLTSTYDHRIIQGAHSGEFLRIIANKLIGEDGFYDRIFASLRIPYEPVRWVRDASVDPDTEAAKPARIAELIHAYRSRGHFMADTDPLAYRQRKHPDLDVQTHGLNLWDLDRVFPVSGFGGHSRAKLRDVLGLLRDSYCRTVGIEYMHLSDRRQRRWLQERLEAGYARTPREDQLRVLRRLNAAEAFETFLQTKFVGQKRFSLEGA